MNGDVEKGHGDIMEICEAPALRLQRPLTADEKLAATTVEIESRGSNSTDDAVLSSVSRKQDHGILAGLRAFEMKMDSKIGVESQAIDRKLPEERTGVSWFSQLNMALLWASGTLQLSSFATGMIGFYFGLSLKQNILVIIFGSLLGGAVGGFSATFGAAMGLRQISVGRYSMGWYPNKVIAALNIVQQLGWSAVGCITSGLALQAVSNGGLSIAVGIVIVAFISFCISFVGLRTILVYERFAWLLYFIIFMIIFGETAPYYDNTTPAKDEGATLSGQILTLLAIVYGSSASWAVVTSDYYVHYPVDVSRTKVFILTALGIAVPTSIGMLAGACIASGLNVNKSWADANDQGLGYLIQEVLYPRGFADVILVLLVLSAINTNTINGYSAAISCQQFARPLAKVPRFIWTFLCFGAIIALALAGRNNLLAYLQNFLGLLGYWCTSYFVILFSEFYIFRKGSFANYDLEGWNDPKVLPMGLAAGTSFGLGVIAWVMGMDSTWYVGPLAATIGRHGGDVANQFTFVVTILTYIPLRYIELRHIGR